MRRIRITSIIMIILSLPMTALAGIFLIASISDGGFQPVGCLLMMPIYLFTIATAIVALVQVKKPGKKAFKIMGWIQLVLSVGNVYLMREYALFLLPPILILTVILLTGKVK